MKYLLRDRAGEIWIDRGVDGLFTLYETKLEDTYKDQAISTICVLQSGEPVHMVVVNIVPLNLVKLDISILQPKMCSPDLFWTLKVFGIKSRYFHIISSLSQGSPKESVIAEIWTKGLGLMEPIFQGNW